MTNMAIFTTWVVASCISPELLGYGLHRLVHSGAIGLLSRNHMKHHLVLYGPLQAQRWNEYRHATDHSFSLRNGGVEWLVPAAFLGVFAVGGCILRHLYL